MSDVDALGRENDELRRQLADARQAVDAFARTDASTPGLVEVAHEKARESLSLLRAVFDGSLDTLILPDDFRHRSR